MGDWKSNCMYAMAGAASMYLYQRYAYGRKPPCCSRCSAKLDRLSAGADVRAKVPGYNTIKQKAQRTLASAVDTALSYLGFAMGGISMTELGNLLCKDPLDPLTRQLRDYIDEVFFNEKVQQRFPAKPAVLEPSDIEFLYGNDDKRVCIGHGSMGAIFLGKLCKTGAKVAIKIATDERCEIHFVMHEASLMTHLNDTGATPFCHGLLPMASEHGFDPDEPPMAAIVMEFIGEKSNTPALDLQKFILDHRSALTTQQLRGIFIEVANKLEKVHAKGIMVNDLKEANVLVTYNGKTAEAFLIDVGSGRYGIYEYPITREVRQKRSEYCHLAPELMRYQDPELYVSPLTDIYSYGKMIDDIGRLLNEMVFMECGIFCTRITPRKRLSLAKVRAVLEKTKYSCVMEDVVTVDDEVM